MGVERMHPPKYWLMRAEEFHTKADNCQYPGTRDSLRQVAKNFEALARQAQMILDLTTQSDERCLEARRVAQEHADEQRMKGRRTVRPLSSPASIFRSWRFRWRGVAACQLTSADRKFAARRQFGGL